MVEPDDVAFGQPVILVPSLAHRDVLKISVQHRDRCGGMLDKRLQKRLMLAERLLRPLAVGDISHKRT